MGPDGSLYIADHANARIRRVALTLPGFSLATNQVALASSDGNQLYMFDGNGRDLQTLDAFTHAILYTFSYDSSGRLSTVTDVNGNMTQITRDASGNPMSIVGPFGEQTTLAVDGQRVPRQRHRPGRRDHEFTYVHGADADDDGRTGRSAPVQLTTRWDDCTRTKTRAGGSKTLTTANVSSGRASQ